MPKDETKQDSRTPPYLAFKRFKRFEGFVKSLHERTTIPARIDRTLMGRMSGADQSQLCIALRFLGLIDPEERATEAMRSLIDVYGKAGYQGASWCGRPPCASAS